MPHRFDVSVHYEDTDMGGIVYHANYLKFIERARSAWVRALGIDQMALRQAGTVFAVRRIGAEFLATATLDDRLRVTTTCLRVSGARLVLQQEIRCGEREIFRAEVELVAIDRESGAARRLPAVLRRIGP